MPDSTGLISECYLTEVSPTDKPWDVHRANAELVASLYSGSDYQGYADRIQDCSKLLGFILEAKDSGELKLRLRQAKFCRVRHCPVCQWRRSLMWRARFLTAIPKVLEAYPKHRWVFLTLTARNCPLTELRTTLGGMNKGWKRLTERKSFPAIGFVKSVEVTRAYDCYSGSDYLGRHGSTWIKKWEKEHKKTIRAVGTDEAHPHFHVLMLVSSSYFGGHYIKQEEWRELWQSALQVDYLPVVNVKAVKPKSGEESQDQGIAIAVCEVLKYGIKEADLLSDREWLEGITRELHKTRAVSVGGVLRQFIQEEEPEDLIGESEETTESDLEIWFGWREMVKRYAKLDRC